MKDAPASSPRQLAQGLYLWYVLATTVPLLILGGLAYHEVHRSLSRAAEQTLHRQAKGIGMHLFRRLKTIEAQLADVPIEELLKGDDTGRLRELDRTKNDPSKRETGARLAVRVTETEDGTVEVLLEPSGWQKHRSERYALSIPLEQLSIPEELVRDDLSYCIADSELRPIFCTDRNVKKLLDRLPDGTARRTSAVWEWELGETKGVAAYWRLFLRSGFDAKDWTVVTSLNEKQVFATLSEFQLIFPRVLLVAMVLALLLASVQLRFRLRPLDLLVGATRRFVAGNYDTRVEVTGKDEISTLSDCFNRIASHTELQFRRLRALSNLDRDSLQSPGAQRIAESALTQINELVGLSQSTYVDLSRSDGRATTTVPVPQSRRTAQTVALRAEVEEWLEALQGPASTAMPLFTGLVGEHRQVTLIPVTQHQRPLGVVVIPEVSIIGTAQAIDSLVEFCERFALALTNAHWEEELYRQAHFDSLTGLPNRVLLDDRLKQAMHQADRQRGHCAVLFLDLDGFKGVNDSLGHEVGDAYLIEIAKRLQNMTRAVDSVVRFGGDEFIVLISGLADDDHTAEYLGTFANRLIEAISRRVEIDRYPIALGASIGIAVYPNDGINANELLRNADTAMYHAKGEGRGRVSFFQSQMNIEAREQLALRQAFSEAMEDPDEQFYVEYQPQVGALQFELVGVEALIRWRHPKRGLIPPSTFVPLAEEGGQIIRLGEWALRRACSDIQTLRASGIDIPRISVNVSVKQFLEPNFPDVLDKVLEQTELPRSVLELEITEDVLLQDAKVGKARLQQFSEQGIKLALDDFGTGYSSLAYLQHLPLDALKIDRCFVEGMGDHGPSDAIVTTTITLGRQLGLRLIAEGVEHRAQLELLCLLGCEEIQGFLFSKPLQLVELADLASRGTLLPAESPDDQVSGA